MTEQKQAIVTILNHYLAIITLLGFIFLLFWILGIIGTTYFKKECKISTFFGKYALPFGFLSTFFAMLMSLYYSDYLGVLPCGLCWFQRITIYSQVFLFGLAWYKKDYKIFPYSILLSSVGMVIALYHEYLQLGYNEFIPCPAIASTVDCAKPTFIEYGFVTFPFMSVVLFLFLILLSFISMKKSN